MHEFSIAAGLVERLLEFAGQNPDKTIYEVKLEVGELSHIEHDQLIFCYSSITGGGPLQGSLLCIETVEAFVECSHCSYRGRPKYWDDILAGGSVVTLQCPTCGKTVDETQGRECAIKSVRLIQAEAIPL
jgi:hydrogenase nickel incorporation protein HypA/HybF